MVRIFAYAPQIRANIDLTHQYIKKNVYFNVSISHTRQNERQHGSIYAVAFEQIHLLPIHTQ